MIPHWSVGCRERLTLYAKRLKRPDECETFWPETHFTGAMECSEMFLNLFKEIMDECPLVDEYEVKEINNEKPSRNE